MASVNIPSGLLATPSSVARATTSNYISTANLIEGGSAGEEIHKRDVDEQLIKRYGKQGITGLLELLGSKKETSAQTFEHYEEALLHNTFSGTLSSGTLTVAAGDLNDSYSALRVGDLLLVSTTGEILYVKSGLSQPDNTATVVNIADNGNGTDFSGKSVSIIGNAFAEKTGQPEGLTPRVHHYSNKCQIIKESFVVSGSEATNAIYVKVNSPEHGSGYLWYLKGEADTYQRFQDYAEMQCLLGTTASGSLVDANSNAIVTTEGLLPFIENKGQSMDLGSSAITMADFDAAVKSLDKYRGSKEMALYAGINLSLDIDDLLAAQGAYAAGGANYGTFANNKDMALNLGFNSFSRGGYTFHKKTYDLFNRPDLLGADGFNYNGYGMCIPMDSQKDAKSGEKIPSLRIRYKAANGYSREMEHWLTGGAILQNKTDQTDELRCNYRTERGFEGFAPNRFLLFKKS